MSETPEHATSVVAVTVTSPEVADDGCWAVVDTQGRSLRLPSDALDPRLATLHPGQRLRVIRHLDGTLSRAGL